MLSYSYLIEAEGKRIVYSGDVGKYEELDDAIGRGCDAVIIETGHFGIDEVWKYMHNKNIGKFFFSHNGREIMNNPKEAMKKIQKLFGEIAIICEDGWSLEL